MNQNEETSHDLHAQPTLYEMGMGIKYFDVKAAIEEKEKREAEKEEREAKVLNLMGKSSIALDNNTVYNTMKQTIGGHSREWTTPAEEFPEWLKEVKGQTLFMTQEAFDMIEWAGSIPYPTVAKGIIIPADEKGVAIEINSLPVIALVQLKTLNPKIIDIDIVKIVFIMDVPGESFVIASQLLDVTLRKDAFTGEAIGGPEFHITGLNGENLWQKNSFAFTDVKGHSYLFSRDNADFTVIL